MKYKCLFNTNYYSCDMKKFAMFICFMFSLIANSQETDCSKFRTGHYKFLNEDLSNIYIIRTDSIQEEVITGPKEVKLTCRITWLSDCLFETEYIDTDNPDYSSYIGLKSLIELSYPNGDTITTKIIDPKTDYFVSVHMIKVSN